MAEVVRLIDFERHPEHERRHLNHYASQDYDSRKSPQPWAMVAAMLQKEGDRDEGSRFDRRGHVTVSPGEVPAPDRVASVQADARENQKEGGCDISLYLRAERLPAKNDKDDGENDQRIEQENGFLGGNKRTKKSLMKRRLPWIICRQGGVETPVLDCEIVHVSIRPRPETTELVEAINRKEEYIDGNG